MTTLSFAQRARLLAIAHESIRHGLTQREVRPPADILTNNEDTALLQPGASFVTLQLQGELRGCIGSLQPYQSLLQDVAHNAFSAAFRDPRFPPLSAREFSEIELHISVLSPTELLQFSDEADLLQQLRPSIDGLVLTEGRHRGTFLPQVWEQLPEPVDFLSQLKRKAGLPPDYWSPTLQVERYTVTSIP